MFGKYYRQIDDKNRVVVPPKLLQELAKEFYITIGIDKNLVLRTVSEFQKMKTKLEEGNTLNKNVRDFIRYIFGNTEVVSPDKNNRIMIPKHLLNKAAIDKEVVFLGTGDTCELFAKEVYDEQESYYENDDNVNDLAQKLFEAGVKF
ncbi:cell division/cell wall cluster transcriptional repressor MraZ [Metamycoplasma hominis]|uniref:division/cell wall cluster transcriptional repressor MraZ n=1 Tax=Metamycoplasma hominis TaxID=2098 RepID=UPI00093C5845|nr:division/cell wall cluster transcriptional repressor MraZ [Metamycoplasma hominis]OKL23650.1 cell division/cell wall cluster transcriptional repressor MraZ [Metamycoplasma hominis]